jgi:membrane-associated phospholipid phosphatase
MVILKIKALKDYIRRNPHVYLVLYVPVYLIMFAIVELLVPSGSDYWVSYMPLDDQIPFVPAFVIPYCLWYPYLVVTGLYLLVKDRDNFIRYMLFIILGFTLSLLFCLIFPNGQNLRPAEFEHPNVFTWMLGIVYSADTNTNVFPSMHVIGCMAASVAAWRSASMKRLRIPSLILAILISASTVFVKQHSFLDIIGGAVFGCVLFAIIYILPRHIRRLSQIWAA